MTRSDDPFDTRNNKTVIRPRPGGAPSGASPFGGAGGPNSTVFSPQPFGVTPDAGFARMPAPGYSGPNDWVPQQAPELATPNVAESRTPRRKIPLNVAINAHTNAQVKATNPITQAAVPLLVLLGRLRQMVVEMDAVPLMQHVSRSINEFERTLLAQGIDQEQVQVAKYTLCATADDIVQNLPGTEKHVWLQYSMLAQFFGVRTSGTVLFDKIRQLIANPTVYYNLLELIHACLSLGFEGQYRAAAGGDIELQRVRRDVFQTLRTARPRGADDISPRWRGVATRLRGLDDGVPLWVFGAVAVAFLAGLYMLLRFFIAGEGDAVAQTLVQMHPKTPIEIQRQEFKPLEEKAIVVDTTQLDRIRGALAEEISGGMVAVEPKGERIVIAVNNVLLFDSGSADVRPEFAELAHRIAASLDKEPGSINIVGHTDNVKPRPTSRFKSNYDLSVKRAESVAKLLEGLVQDPSRIQVEGRGEDDPVAPNDTPEGRAKNRRVEITIPREETL